MSSPPQATPLEALRQSASPDTTAAAAQDTSAISRLGDDLSDVIGQLLRGEWDQVGARASGAAVDLVDNFVPWLIVTALILLVLFLLFRVVERLLDRVLTRSRNVDAGLRNLLMKTYRVVGFAFIVVMLLDRVDFNVTALVAGLSIVGLAVGFAARDSLENFISGITILIDRPFRVGDNIEINDQFGTIEEITLRSTRLRTLNNQIMVMPNVQMINQQLVNHTMLGTVRVQVLFGIAYDEYPAEAREVVLGLTEGDTRLHPDYQPAVVVTTLNESSVDMELRLYLRNPKMEVPVRLEYTEKVLKALREAGITIPYPHRSLYIEGGPAVDRALDTRAHMDARAHTSSLGEDAPPGEQPPDE